MLLKYHGKLENHSPSTVFAWHTRPGAFGRLTPPWVRVEPIRSEGGIRDGGKVDLRIHRGPLSTRWSLRHRDYIQGAQFCDEQVSGPMKSWRHIHKFSELAEGGTGLIDEISVQLPAGTLGKVFGARFLKGELDRLFQFRHRRLLTDLARHARYLEAPRLTVAITGSSGLVGRSLTDFLTTGGHKVIRLVRDPNSVGHGRIYWDPQIGELDLEGLAAADAVVNLAGVPIADRPWTASRKRSIRGSRIEGTSLLSRALKDLKDGPRALISSSAVGYYGNQIQECIGEDFKRGTGFLSDVCDAWEKATEPAEKAGIRVAHIRTGIVLSSGGGALQRLLLPFIMGLGGRLGSGDQFLSWVDVDDVVGAIHHILMSETLDGPINVTAPNPVTNSAFTSTLGLVMRRPTVIPIPRFVLSTIFGQMGREALLEGQSVFPKKLKDSGFEFFYEGLEDSLRFQLGRMNISR